MKTFRITIEVSYEGKSLKTIAKVKDAITGILVDDIASITRGNPGVTARISIPTEIKSSKK